MNRLRLEAKKMSSTHLSKVTAGLFVAVTLFGCGPSTLTAPDTTATGVNKGPKFNGPPSDAGLPIPENKDANEFPKLVASNASRFQARPDPFALTSGERAFEVQQSSERLFSSAGGFTTAVQPINEVVPPPYVEPQPYRRLSGVVVGDSVLAIIEMGNGAQTELVRPGMKIPNSEWTVVSIDPDKAVLRRDGSVLPKEIVVRLETPPPGFGPASGIGAGGFPGGRGPGGFPGGPGGFPGGPGGFPGGPGGRRGGGLGQD